MKKDRLKCKYGGNGMVLEDVDYDVKNYYDNYYWLCKKCGARAVEKVRYGKRVTVEWLENEEKDQI